MRIRRAVLVAALVMLATVPVSADRVRLRSGKVVAGIFIGGDSRAVRLLLESGEVSEIPLTEAVAVEFTARKAPAAAPAPSPTPGAAAPRPVAVSVPAGTAINVRLTQPIDVDSSKAGMSRARSSHC